MSNSSSLFSSSNASNSISIARPSDIGTHSNSKQVNISDKIISDLEDLGKKLANLQQTQQADSSNQDFFIRDDCYELQKFCAKLEFLFQFNLKEKRAL